MDLVILAAGYGRGLEPITHTRNKSLIPILGEPLLIKHLKAIGSLGSVENVVIVVNYLHEQVVNAVSKVKGALDYNIIIKNQEEPLGTGHALSTAISEVSSNEFIVIYGDVFFDYNDLKKLAELKGNVVCGYRVPDPSRYGVLVLEGNTLRKIFEKPSNPPTNLINAGIYKFRKSIIKYLSELKLSPRGEYELTDAINDACSKETFRVYELNYWADVGRPWKVLEVHKYLLSKLRKSEIKGEIESNVVVRGTVFIGEGAEVASGTYIRGPVWVGRRAVIGPNAYIRPYTVVLDNAKIGFNVEVKESIIMEGVHVSHQAYVGDSIICEHSNLGAGTILANLKFDESEVKVFIKGKRESSGRRKLGAIIGAYVKTGVNVSVFPGVKIGACSWIYPGVTVRHDVPPCTIVKSEDVLEELKKYCRVDLSVWR
ncbi:MAG: NTP transferase domain-containing protein [Desulfurococcales archaeon]|nr:NTP transferase domain-containing protein [Desulfurococcales archaeon]